MLEPVEERGDALVEIGRRLAGEAAYRIDDQLNLVRRVHHFDRVQHGVDQRVDRRDGGQLRVCEQHPLHSDIAGNREISFRCRPGDRRLFHARPRRLRPRGLAHERPQPAPVAG